MLSKNLNFQISQNSNFRILENANFQIPKIQKFSDSKNSIIFGDTQPWFKSSQLTLICRFIVIQKSVIKYMTRMGQKTGTLKTSKKVQTRAIVVLFVIAYQNLNSGSRRMKGRNSSLFLVGSSGPSGSSAGKFIQIFV